MSTENKEEQRLKDRLNAWKNRFPPVFLVAAEHLLPYFPRLGIEMMQVGMDAEPREHLAEAVGRGLKGGVAIGVTLVAIGFIFDSMTTVYIGLGLTPVVGIALFLQIAKLPALKVKKKTRELEKDLPYALKSLLIEVRSGVPLYTAMATVTEGYGLVSEEFTKILAEINAGKDEAKALENAVLRNPSEQFRRVLWQLSNALRAGSDLGDTLDALVRSIIEDQMLEIEEYGRKLNPYTLVYMLASVILPSLGVTFLMILSIFTGSNIGANVFYAVIGFLLIFQFFFINFVKSKRPQIKQ